MTPDHDLDEEESPASYHRMLDSYFQAVDEEIDEAFLQCFHYSYPEGLSHVDLVVYPESFAQYFAVYVRAVMKGGETAATGLDLVFCENVKIQLSRDLDPYDVDFDWRDEIFRERLCRLLSTSWERCGGFRAATRFYAMTPDAPRSWLVNSAQEVLQEEK